MVTALKPAGGVVAGEPLSGAMPRTWEFEPSPLLKRFHRDRRILIIDDFSPTLKDIHRDLGQCYKQEDGCVVEAESDPKKALEKIIAAQREGRPYDALVLDLFMPGLHGDELLRRIAEENAFAPTVVHSGSWAEDMHSHLFHNLETARTEQELEAAERDVRRRLGGVPITFVKKFAGDTRDIALALDAVMLAGEEADTDEVQGFVRDFKPKLVETTTDREAISKMSEVVRWYGRRLDRFLEWAGEEQPEFKDTSHYERIKEVSNLLLGPEYSARALMEEKDNLGAARRHNIATILMQPVGEFGCLGSSTTALKEITPTGKILKRARLLETDAFDVVSQVTLLRGLYGKEMVYDCGEYLDTLVNLGHNRGKALLHPPDEPLYIKAGEMLFKMIVDQPISNAIKATKDRPDGEVEVFLRKTRVGDIPGRARTCFTSQGMSENDFVAHVAIKDNGVGMTPEKLAEVNSPEGDVESTFGTSGFGLGYLKQYIGRCGGTYHAESEPGDGTSFHMYFMLAEPPEKED